VKRAPGGSGLEAGGRSLRFLCLLLIAIYPSALSAQDSATSSSLQPPASSPALRIGVISIVIGDVFATETPEEDRLFYRVANRLHIETRVDVVRRQLLFKEGDVYVERLLRESERILRRNKYLFDAEIAVVAEHDGLVDIEVRTRDVWTFKPGIQYTRTGGEEATGFELQESNLLGFGKEVTVAHKENVDRRSDEFRYFDPQLFGSRARFALSYADNSDGRQRSGFVEQPFYSLDTRWAATLSALDSERTDQRYVLGTAVDEFRHRQQAYQLFGGFSPGLNNGWVRRYSFGAAFVENRFAATGSPLSAAVVPPDRKLVYPFVGFSMFEDRFEERRNEDQIERTEDLFAGKFFQASFGWASREFDSSDNAALLSLGFGNTLETEDRRHTLVMRADAAGRIHDDELANGVLTSAARYYWRMTPRQLFFASLSGSLTDRLDAERQLTLGGDSGLRGYPLRYQDGSAAALVTLEHRVYTKYYLFRLFHLGGAVFFDAGRTWGEGNAPKPAGIDTRLGLLKNVGLGLRFGSSRSAFGNVIHVDLAFPLDGDPTIDRMQFVVESKASF